MLNTSFRLNIKTQGCDFCHSLGVTFDTGNFLQNVLNYVLENLKKRILPFSTQPHLIKDW